jgi:hypothetical protein
MGQDQEGGSAHAPRTLHGSVQVRATATQRNPVN